MAFWRKKDEDLAAVLRKVGKREPFRWVRQLDDAELERLAENVRRELVTCDSRDELLETAARLHYQTQPRLEGRLKRGEDVVDEEAARGRVLAAWPGRRVAVRPCPSAAGRAPARQDSLYPVGIHGGTDG